MTELLDESNLNEVYVDLQVFGNPLYEGKTFRLRFRFSPMYPVEVPWVQFVNRSAGVMIDEALQRTIQEQKREKQHDGTLSEYRRDTGTPIAQAIGVDGIPVHPHVYGNGHICLDLLGNGWSPVHTISSVAISLQSMLSGNDRNERPPDNNQYVMRAPLNPTKTVWAYHDDNV